MTRFRPSLSPSRRLRAQLRLTDLETRATPAVTTVPALNAGPVDTPAAVVATGRDSPTALTVVTERNVPITATPVPISRTIPSPVDVTTANMPAASTTSTPAEPGTSPPQTFQQAYGTSDPTYDYNHDGI